LKRRKRQVSFAKRKREVQLIPPTAEAARDEGPRLIPLDDKAKEASRLSHYLDLADTALGFKRAPKTK
jgi:hypothetical protein